MSELWIVVLASCGLSQPVPCEVVDWVRSDRLYASQSACEDSIPRESRLFREANPTRQIEARFCMPLNSWRASLPVVSDPRLTDG